MKGTRFYWFMRAVVWPLMHLIFPYKITGKENIPAEGPVLICANHISVIDPVFLACGLKRPVTFIAKKELFQGRFTRWFFTHLGMIPVDRGGTDMASMRASLGVLKEDGVLGIFPQGHRYKKDENRHIENGASLLALKSKATVVPVYFRPPVRPLHFIRIAIHPPIDLSDIKHIDASTMALVDERLKTYIWHDEEPRRRLEG